MNNNTGNQPNSPLYYAAQNEKAIMLCPLPVKKAAIRCQFAIEDLHQGGQLYGKTLLTSVQGVRFVR